MSQAPQDQDLYALATQAGDVAQEVFYTILLATWSYDMGSMRIVNNDDGDLIVIEISAGAGADADPDRKSTCERHAGGWLIKFPKEAFTGVDLEIAHAVLSDQNSLWAFVCMHSIVGMLFQDLVKDVDTDIKEVVHELQSNITRLVVHRSRFGFGPNEREDLAYPDAHAADNLKGVFRITLKDGSQVSLDLAGAQYHLSHPTVMRWEDYLESWVSTIKYSVPFRSHYDKHVEKMNTYHHITHLTVIMVQIGYLSVLVSNCKHELGFDLRELPFMDDDDFPIANESFVQAVHNFMQKIIEELDEGTVRESLVGNFDLRHPTEVVNLEAAIAYELECLPLDIGDITKFDWNTFRELVRMPSSDVKYKEKKKLRLLLSHRCAYKLPGDWRIVFLQETLPSVNIPWSFSSENPYWRSK